MLENVEMGCPTNLMYSSDITPSYYHLILSTSQGLADHLLHCHEEVKKWLHMNCLKR